MKRKRPGRQYGVEITGCELGVQGQYGEIHLLGSAPARPGIPPHWMPSGPVCVGTGDPPTRRHT